MYKFEIINKRNEFAKFKDVFNANQDYSIQLWNAIDLLKEINIKTSDNCKQLQNQSIVSSDINLNSNQIDPLYVQIKDDFLKLQHTHDCLKINFEENKLNSDRLINELNERIINDTQKFEEAIANKCLYYDNIIDKLNTNHELRVADIYNRLYSSEASADIRYDEMQSTMQISIDNINKKLRESNNSNHVIKSELMQLKNQQKGHVIAAEKKNIEIIKGLEDKLLFTEGQLRQTQENLFEQSQTTNISSTSNTTQNIPKLETTNNTSYVPLPVRVNNNLDDFVDSNAFLGVNKNTYKNVWSRRKTGPFYKLNKNNVGVQKIVNTSTNLASTSTSNQEINNEANTSITTRKRKLYNPDDLDYLNNLKHYN